MIRTGHLLSAAGSGGRRTASTDRAERKPPPCKGNPAKTRAKGWWKPLKRGPQGGRFLEFVNLEPDSLPAAMVHWLCQRIALGEQHSANELVIRFKISRELACQFLRRSEAGGWGWVEWSEDIVRTENAQRSSQAGHNEDLARLPESELETTGTTPRMRQVALVGVTSMSSRMRTENVLTPLHSPHPLSPLISRFDRCTYEKEGGEIAHAPTNSKGLEKRWRKHLAGESRLGVFLVLPGNVCRAGVIDLDSHDSATPTRGADAVEILELLDRRGIVAYWAPSRGGRGAHVWILFDTPGAAVADLRAFLNELAAPYKPVDVRPDTSRYGGPIFLPYFGGVVNMRDLDVKPIPMDKLEANNPAAIPQRAPLPRVSTWVPRYKLGRRFSGQTSERFRETLREGEALGLVFYKGHMAQDRQRFRNRIAGYVAGSIVGRGGSFEEFVAWDSHNEPPLKQTAPAELERWWKSAQSRQGK